MTDDGDPVTEFLAVHVCDFGHIHVLFGLDDGSEAHTVFTPTEACAFSKALLKAARDARNLLGIVGRDTGPCSLH